MRNASETELCLVIANSAKKGYIKIIPSEEFGDIFQHLGLYRLSLQNTAGIGKPPRYFVKEAELVINFTDLVSHNQ